MEIVVALPLTVEWTPTEVVVMLVDRVDADPVLAACGATEDAIKVDLEALDAVWVPLLPVDGSAADGTTVAVVNAPGRMV